MTVLRLAENLALPADWMVMATVVYGARGSGKTTLGRVVAEELWKAGQRFGAIDLKGDWWGLKATADGEGAGIPVVIFGGEHADLPLEDGSGALVGEIAATSEHPFVVDLERMSKGRQVRWLKEFFLSLYDHNRDPLLLLADEVQRYAPQRPMSPDETMCLAAVEDVVKLGRKHGLGILALTQRGAGLNKEVSELCDVLVALRTPGPLDQDRIKEWLDANTTRAQRDEVMGRLAKLPTGTAIVASGHPDIDVFATVPIRRSETFDSSATPKVGQARTVPKMLAPVDLDAIRTRLEAAAPARAEPTGTTRDQARAVAEQRRLLEEKDASILALETELRGLRARPTFDMALVDRLAHEVGALESAAMRAIDAAGEVKAEMARHRPSAPATRIVEPTTRPSAPTETRDRRKSESRAAPTATEVTAPQQRLLDTLARYEALGVRALDRRTLAVSSAVSPRSSSYDANVRGLRAAGLIAYPSDGHAALTDAGRAVAATPDRPMTLAALHDNWKRILTHPQAALLAHLIGRHPDGLERETLAALAQVSPRSSSFDANIRHLRSLGLVVYPAPNHVAASALLFPDGLA